MGIFDKTKPDPDRTRLDELAQIVTDNLSSFVRAGIALAEIRDKKLYTLTHSNFADFIEERWGMQVRRAYQLITAAQAATNVQNSAHVPNSHQAERLATVPVASQPAAWNEAIATAPKDAKGQPLVTGTHVEEIAAKYRAKPKRARIKKPKAIILRGKGWRITIERTTAHVDAHTAMQEGIAKLPRQADLRNAA